MSSSVFISHSTADDQFASNIAQSLSSAGIKVWIDHAHIRLGDNFVSEIENAFGYASHVLILFSPNSIVSDWFKEERNAALISAISGKKRIIPAILLGFSPEEIPEILSGRIYVDFNNGDYEEVVSKLISDIRGDTTATAYAGNTPTIDDVQIINHKKTKATGIELLIRNPTSSPILIRRGVIETHFYGNFDICYMNPPPTVIYNLDYDISNLEVDKDLIVGSIAEENDEWNRSIKGRFAVGAYDAFSAVIEFPIYLTVPKASEGIIRFVINNTHKNGGDAIGYELPSSVADRRLASPQRFMSDTKSPSIDEESTLVSLEAQDGKVLAAKIAGIVNAMCLRESFRDMLGRLESEKGETFLP